MQNPPAAAPGSTPDAHARDRRTGISSFCERHYRLLAALTLLLAALNAGYRLDREAVNTWDESLYATSAAEMVRSGNWLVTTFHNEVDYYNSKPPLAIWLLAASFKSFGISLWSLRLPSAIAAFLTIAILQWWCRRCFGALAALLAASILSTTFAFLYVHSARSGNPDALLTLLVLLTVVTLWAAKQSPMRLVWLGPITAGVFLLKGTAVLLPLLIVASVLVARGIRRADLKALAWAAVAFLIPSGTWAYARWRFDGWRFFEAMVNQDFVARTIQVLDRHDGHAFYYLYVLQKDQYDWLAVALILGVVLYLTRRDRPAGAGLSVDRDTRILLGVWAGATLLVPTAMATKLAWYLNPFYPVLAVGVTLVIAAAVRAFSAPTQRRERRIVLAIVALGFVVAEGKLAWYSYQKRDLSTSVQAIFLESSIVQGRRVLAARWDPADQFVLEHVAGGTAVTGDPQQLAREAAPHDLLILQSSREGRWTLTNAR